MEENNTGKKKEKGGRNPKIDPAVYRYRINLNTQENTKFLSLFDQSGMSVKAHFITSCLFNKTIKFHMDTFSYSKIKDLCFQIACKDILPTIKQFSNSLNILDNLSLILLVKFINLLR